MEGCRVRSDIPVANGAYVQLFIPLLGQIAPLFVELAVVRWSSGPLFGLEFIRIVEGHQARLRHYVQGLETDSDGQSDHDFKGALMQTIERRRRRTTQTPNSSGNTGGSRARCHFCRSGVL